MTRNEVLDLMRGYEFTLNMESRKGDETITYYFLSEPVYHRHHKDRIIIPSYGCSVTPKDKRFQFSYVVPHSINTLYSGECSPVDNSDHFFNILTKFEAMVQTLYEKFD